MTMTATPAAPSLLPGEDTGASDSDGVIDSAAPMLVGQTAPGATVTLYDNNFASVAGAAIADAMGFYSIYPDPVLDDGRHSLTITAAAPGQTASQHSPVLLVVVDTAAPDPPTAPVLAATFDTGASAEDGITAKQTLQPTGTAEPGSMVQLYSAGVGGAGAGGAAAPSAQATAGADGSYTLTPGALADGDYMLSVTATDLAGNVSTRSAATSVTVDSKAPAAPAAPTLSPGTDAGVSHSDGLTDDDAPVVVGTTEANATVELFDGAAMVGKATADGAGAYAITSDVLEDGAHALTVEATDAAGNVSAPSAALNVVIDTAGPTGASTPAVVDLGAGSVPFTVHFSEPVTGVDATDFTLVTTNTVSGSVQSVTGSGSDYTVTVSGLDGQGTVGLALVARSVTDLAGNAATLTESDLHPVSGTTQPSTIEVSTDMSGLLGAGEDPSPSASGRLVAFTTQTGSLTTGSGTDGLANVVVRDTLLGKTTLVSYDLDGAAADGASGYASISADGTEIAFASEATNLVDGGTTAGETNVYVAELTEGASGPQVKSITLVSEGNGQQGEGALGDGAQLFVGPILSADGSTVAFDSTQALTAGAESGTENVYAENVATGAITLVSGGTGMDEYALEEVFLPQYGEDFPELVPQPDKAPGTGGDLSSDVTSISADGNLIAYESLATDLGGAAVTVDQDTVPFRGYIYDAATGQTSDVDGTDLVAPSAATDTVAVNTYDPVLSGDGTKVFYDVHSVSGVEQVQALYEDTLATGATTPVSVPSAADGGEVFDVGTSLSKGGGLVLFDENPGGLYTDQPADQWTLDNVLTGTTTALTPGDEEALTSAGDAYVFTEPDADGSDSDQLYETSLGVSAGIDPIGADDAVGASALAKAIAGGGLVVSGTTNAPRGASIAVQLFGASADTTSLRSAVTVVTADGLGRWSATVPTALLQSADGNYALVAQVGTPAGNSFFSVRDFIVDTKAPAAPDAPKLDAGSDTSLANDGSATNQAAPTLTGAAEAGATVTLYDSLAGTTAVAVGTATADGDGVYAITPSSPLADGRHVLDVTATDAAGNVSAASADLSIAVDTVVPAPPTLGLSPGSDTGTSASDGITSDAGPTLTGTGDAGTQITLYDTDGVAMLGTATVAADGTWKLDSSNLSDGAHTLTATDTDKAGNVSAASDPLKLVIDTLPPFTPTIASVTGPLVDGRVTLLVTVSGVAEPDSKVMLQLDGGSAIVGESTAASDGDYSIDSDPLPAGDGQTLAVIAIDAAGNASQPSLPVDVNVTDSATPPPGAPPFTPTLLGLLTDGPIAGATVFADANGDGLRDADEGAAVTGTDGAFMLPDTGGELVASGGADTTTGLSLPGALTAPAHSTVIDALTTLLDAYAAQTGASQAAANAAVAGALGLLGGGGTDLATLDPDAAAISGSPSLDPAVADGAPAVADAKLADLAVDFTAVAAVAGAPSASVLFADVFARVASEIAALPSGATLDLDDPATLLATVQPLFGLNGGGDGAVAAETAAEQIVAAGNTQLDADAGATGQPLLTDVARVEKVEQGGAAAALAQIGAATGSTQPGAAASLAASLVPQFTGMPLVQQASVSAASIIGAPHLDAGSDQGVSDRDEITDDLTPTFVGTALPGTFVTLVELDGTDAAQGQVLGSAQADADGRYSIGGATLTAMTYDNGERDAASVRRVGGTTDQHLAAGSIIDLPAGTQPQLVSFEAPGLSDAADISDAIPAASPGNDAGHSALLLYLDVFAKGTFQVFADGGTTPIATGAILDQIADEFGPLTLTTAPLSLGPHTLTVTDTLPGGTVVTGSPSYDVTVVAPDVVDGTATAVGPIVGGTVTENDANPPALGGDDRNEDRSVTDGDGAYAAVVVTHPSKALTLQDGYDTVTGLPIGGALGGSSSADGTDSVDNPGGKLGATLTAPHDYAAISPLTSVVADLDFDDGNYGAADPGDTAMNAAETLAAFGLSPSLDLSTLDPLTEAQAGDPAPLLATIKLLDTVTVLSEVIGFTFQPFADVIKGGGSLDLDDPPALASAIAGFVTTNDSIYFSTQQVGEVAVIVAAGNAAIDAHAAAATSVADTLSYAFAVERLEQGAVKEAVSQVPEQDPGSPDILQGVVASYTGTALDQAIEAELGQATQAVSLLPQGPASTGAPSVTFAITFSKPVTGLGAASFQLVSGGGLQDAAITGVSAVAGGGGESYDVSVSTGIGSGTLALTYLGGGVDTAAGEPTTAGTLAPAATYLPLPGGNTYNTKLAVGDFNGDGRPDAVLVSRDVADPAVTVYLNTGGGAFQAEAPISTDADYDSAVSPVVADVNGDGKADIVVAEDGVVYTTGSLSYGDAVTVLLGDGDGSFEQPVSTPLDFSPTDMVAGDFNGDGKVDLALSDGSGAVHILLGNGAGGFTPVSSFAGGAETGSVNYASMAVGDFNGDGRPDLAIGNYTAGTVSIFLGDGDGTFTAGPVIATGAGSDAIAVGDLNHDGVQDIAVADRIAADATTTSDGTTNVAVLLGKGDGTFTTAAPATLNSGVTEINGGAESVAIGDVDGDGNPDLVVGASGFSSSSSTVSVLLGNGDGTFRLGSQNFNGDDATNVALADVDGDGRTDVLTSGADLAPDVNSDIGLNVFMNEPETVVGSTSPSVAIDRPAVAAPALSEASGGGTFTQAGNAYTLDLGTVAAGATAAFSLANAAAAPADSFDGTFSAPAGTGFTVAGASLPQALAAGQSYAGLSFGVSAAAPGAYSETITFAPRDATAVAATVTPPDPDGGAVAPAAAAATDPVAAELPAITLTVTADVSAGAASPAILAPVPAVSLPDARVGGADGEPLTIINAAAAPAADLDVAAAAAGDATVSGGVSGLAPQASDAHSLVVGLDTSAAGLRSGTVTLSPSSEPDTALPDQDVAVSGSVFREAAASIAPVAVTVHVGDPGSVALPVANADPADGFSEALVATLAGAAAGLSVASAGPTADVAAGATDASSLALGFSTAAAGTITGSADVALSSDGGTGAGGVDGLGQVALASATVPVAVTVDNYARAGFTAAGGTLTAGVAPGTYVLNLGTTTLGGAALSADLSVLNDVQGPADLLGGSFTAAAGPFVNDGFASFGGLGAGAAADAGSVSLAAAQAGTFSETVDLAPTDAEGAGSPVSALPAITLTVTADVMPCFHAGTRIATPGGPMAVETLRVGDLVSTASGRARPVVWVGRRRVDCTRHPRPELVHPVRVAAGAFGRRLPSRDLILSPDHAVFAEGVLIPIKRLVNGASVAVEPRASVDYLHIELDRHDVVLAEGLPAESYLDAGDRDRFAGGARVALHPDFSTRVWEAEGCAPLRIVGPEVDRVRDALVRRAKRARAKARTQKNDLREAGAAASSKPVLSSRSSRPDR